MPAIINAIGTPCIPLGTSTRSNCSRNPAKIVIASINPSAQDEAYITLSRMLTGNFCVTNMATPKTAQLVVIKGK